MHATVEGESDMTTTTDMYGPAPESIRVGGLLLDLTLHDQTLLPHFRPARYGWTIDSDERHKQDPSGHPADETGAYGPATISAEIMRILSVLTPGGYLGRAFRIYAEDGELLYTGRIITSDEAIGSWYDDAPLDDFARQYEGWEIRYWDSKSHDWVKR